MTQENFPFLGKNIFSWVSSHDIYLEIVSGKSPESHPKIAKAGKNLEKVSGISPESRPFFGNSCRDLPIWVNLYGSFQVDLKLSNFINHFLTLLVLSNFGLNFPALFFPISFRTFRVQTIQLLVLFNSTWNNTCPLSKKEITVDFLSTTDAPRHSQNVPDRGLQ